MANARPHSSMEPIFTRIHVRKDRLWKRRSERVHAGLLDAHAAIVDGSRVSIEQAPWQVVVIAFISETEALLCGGSILDETEILTAGHCVFNPSSKTRIPPEDIVVGAGTENIEVRPEQVSLADGLRVHPYYDPSAPLPEADDVAVLQLERSLVFNRNVQAIAPIAAGSLLSEGTAVHLTGFGAQHPEEGPNGRLYGLGMTLGSGNECGGEASALFLCASSPDGSLCFGDSGSALTLPGASATLVGVTDTVQVIDGQPCLPGATGGFVDLAAPEIGDFVFEDNESPPRAPRGGGVAIRGVPVVGQTLNCESGVWSASPTFTYAFIDNGAGTTLQEGSSSAYVLSAADLGRSILCQVFATNAGGTGIERTAALGAVQPGEHEEEEKRKEEAAKRKQAEEELEKHQEAEANREKTREEEVKQIAKLAEEATVIKREAEALQKKREAEAAANHPEGSVAKGGVLAAKETAKPKSPTRAQLLANALKACKKQPTKRRRVQCEAQARKRHGSRKGGGKRHKK
ncbi:MAG TPA: trypsin-like serine protease [Solirubrobacteraceae bacterium]|nr:trypsin-like serine protease [Solirubrobacteraceae bacterium]